MKHIIVHSEAELELWQAVEYYEAKRVGLGLNLEQEVSHALADIQEAPDRWPKRSYGTRCHFSICYLLFGSSRCYLGSSCSTHQP